jgi:hypothetical protein
MKNIIGSTRIFFSILFIFSLLNTQNAKAQDCVPTLKQLNKIATGIPAARIQEYEYCVANLDGSEPSRTNNKDLLKICYIKLINYYDAYDNQSKVNFYRIKLQRMPR